ncbi:MAG: hypothetical protein BGP16_05480 [Sphingobium sp. 66-54]|nr:MAG: hypothetical protein BGP16_05480 [Sphingobium sp. 66-54]
MRKANIATRARWAHKRNGTPETHEHASHVRQGALARLYQSGAIDAELLCAGTEIGDAAQLVMRDVDIRTASLETRVDSSPRGGFFFETLGRVRIEAAYSRWRRQVGPAGPLTLTIVLDDIGIAAAAALHHMSARRARQLLVQALELWQSVYADARRDIDPAALADAQAPIL